MSKSNWGNPGQNDRRQMPRSDTWKRSPAKKDTKQWCHGKVGVPHTWGIRITRYAQATGYECHWRDWWYRDKHRIHYSCWHERYCVVCGKVAHGGRDRLRKEECPNWVPYVAVSE